MRAGGGALFNLTGHWLRLNAAYLQRSVTTLTSALAGGVDTLRRAALRNYRWRTPPACQRHCS